MNVGRNEFYPVPNVDSEVICFELKDNKEYLKDDTFFFKLVRDSFKFKRKTIRNNLKNYENDIIKVIDSFITVNNYDINLIINNIHHHNIPLNLLLLLLFHIVYYYYCIGIAHLNLLNMHPIIHKSSLYHL